MARGEVEGTLLTVQTTLTYDATVNYGHASAGKDLVLSLRSIKRQCGAWVLTVQRFSANSCRLIPIKLPL